MLPSFCKDVAVIYRAPFIEQRGSKVRDWTNATAQKVKGCSLQQIETESNNGIRENSHSTFYLYCPPNTDISKGDKVVIGGIDYMVEGEPFEWNSPTNAVSHVEAKLIRRKG